MKITVENGLIIDPKNKIDELSDLFISDHKICGVGSPPSGFQADVVIDAENQVVCPGFIEIGCDLGDLSQKDDVGLEMELYAAASGGFTSVCLLPNPTHTLEKIETVEQINRKSKVSKGAKVKCIGALTQHLEGKILSEMEALKNIGCIGVSNGGNPIVSTSVLRNALSYASTLELVVMLESQDAWLNASGVMRCGAASILAGLPGIPNSSELIGLSRNLLLVEETGVKAHMRNLSVSRSVELIEQYPNPRITCDVGLLHLLLCDDDLDPFDPNYNVLPPLPTATDQDSLLKHLSDRKIDILSSQHQPIANDLKRSTFESSKPGISSFDTFLSLMLSLAEAPKMQLSELINAVTNEPAKTLGLNEGNLSVGSQANICIFDPDMQWKVDRNTLRSRGKNTPFLGKVVQGKVTHTIIEGEIVYCCRETSNFE